MRVWWILKLNLLLSINHCLPGMSMKISAPVSGGTLKQIRGLPKFGKIRRMLVHITTGTF